MPELSSHVSPSLPPAHLPLRSEALQSFSADTESVRSTLQAVRAEQSAHDRAHDMADLHQLMRTALAARDDVSMIEILQIGRGEIPDAIKTLERALEHIIEDRQVDTTALPSQEAGNDNGPSLKLEPGNTGASHSSVDPLDREFIVNGIGAMQSLSKGTDRSWAITWSEIDTAKSIGSGSFKEVFRSTWHKDTVAVKVLDKTAPRETFQREVKIWKSLFHPNVLELLGASSASDDSEPPWFLVRDGLSFLILVCLSNVGLVQTGLRVLSTRKPRQVLEGLEQG
jgi:abelson tyrosine-protein kinase 1